MRSPIFLQAGCSVAIEIERPAKQPARYLDAANGQPKGPAKTLLSDGLDLETEEGRFQFALRISNLSYMAVNGR